MNPEKIGEAFFAAQHPKPAPAPLASNQAPEPEPKPLAEPRPKTLRAPARPAYLLPPLSARQTARRLAILLRQLQEISNDAFLTLPAKLKFLVAKARSIAVAPTLPVCSIHYDTGPRSRGHTPSEWRTLEL